MLALQTIGYAVLVPFGENTRYDLAIDDGASLPRVQCKTGRLRGGAICFSTTSISAHHKRPVSKRSYHGEVDHFAVYCPETGGVYLIPLDDVPTRNEAALRVEAPRNGQRRRIRPALDYLVAYVPVTCAAAI